jgi:hypothetical protein
MRIALLMLATACWACGDPRDAFEGAYSGAAHVDGVTSGGDSVSFGFQDFWVITKSEKRNDALVVWGECDLLFTVDEASTIRLEPKLCPAEHHVNDDGTACTVTPDYESGTAELRDDGTLHVSYTSTQTISDCTNGSPNVSAHLTTRSTLRRHEEPKQ